MTSQFEFPIHFAILNDGFEIGTPAQRIRCSRETGDSATSPKTYSLTTHVQDGESWRPLFNADSGLLTGTQFGLHPTDYRVIEDSPERVAVLLMGSHAHLGYAWGALIEVRRNSPWIRFRIDCHLTSDLHIQTPEPSVLLWLNDTSDLVTLDQGPVSIYGGHSWGNSFPAAYLWSDGIEAILFFNMTPARWMSSTNLRRFHDYRVATIVNDDRAGFGLHALSRTGETIQAGHLVLEFYLLQRSRPSRPTRIEALDHTIHACADLLPARADFPENYAAPYELNWRTFAEGVMADLMREHLCWADLPSTWTDSPAFPERRVETFRLHSDYAARSSRTQHTRADVFEVWDYACCNNFVAPWLIYDRLHPNEAHGQMLNHKLQNLPMFYDPQARLFRWGAGGVKKSLGMQSTMANGVEMSWENFMFHLETAKIHNAAAPADFNPAALGRLLMACETLVEYAHRVNYVFPQWFDAFDKTPMMQLDIPALGKVREPFQVGTYAYLMLEVYLYTSDERWLEEAKRSLTYVLTEMQYTEINARYVATYTEAVDVPIAETFGNGYAVAAAQRLYNLTGDETFRRYAADYLNILARMAFWYKDDSDAVAHDLNNLGLFRAHGGHYGTCPWENIEAYLPLSVYLKHNTAHDDLLLKLFNLQRITSFYYFPPVWTSRVAAPNPELYHHICQYLPIENFYTLEFGGTHGSMGRCIYMCSQAIWNYLLYEAFASASDREIMVLSLDLLDGLASAMDGQERHFVVFNPTDQTRDFTLCMAFLSQYGYAFNVLQDDRSSDSVMNAEQLTQGIKLSLRPYEHIRIHLTRNGADRSGIDTMRRAQGLISQVYARLQVDAETHGLTDALSTRKAIYAEVLEQYRAADYSAAAQQCETLMAEWV